MEVSDQLHHLYPFCKDETSLSAYSIMSQGGSQVRYGSYGKEKNIFPLPRIEPWIPQLYIP
jgi:hypothetical protein